MVTEVAQDQLVKLQRIESQRLAVEAGAMRLRLLKEVMGARIDQRAEYAVLVGCHAPFRFYHVKSFVDLLERLGVSYSFLSQEFCCGGPYLPKNDQSPELEALEPYAQDYQGRNMAEAEALGAKAVVTFCANCNARYRRHLKHASLPILYWTDLVAAQVGGLGLEAKVDFYEGCHQDQNLVLSNAIDPATSKRLVERVKGLAYCQVSSEICCQQRPQDIFGAMQTRLLVTPTSCCFGNLYRARPEGVHVAFLTDLLLWAMDGRQGAA